MISDEVRQAIEAFVHHMMNITVRIAQFNDNGFLTGRRSGFLYQAKGLDSPIVITAGHGCPATGSFIETPIVRNGHTLSYNAGRFDVAFSEQGTDFAISKVPFDLIRRDLTPDMKIEYVAFQHSFGEAIKGEGYGFAVWNSYELVKSGDKLFSPNYPCYEIGMQVVEEDEWQYYFKTDEPLKDDSYYEGASGAPIANPEGQICSILLGRTDDGKYLRGHKLRKLNKRIDDIAFKHERV